MSAKITIDSQYQKFARALAETITNALQASGFSNVMIQELVPKLPIVTMPDSGIVDGESVLTHASEVARDEWFTRALIATDPASLMMAVVVEFSDATSPEYEAAVTTFLKDNTQTNEEIGAELVRRLAEGSD